MTNKKIEEKAKTLLLQLGIKASLSGFRNATYVITKLIEYKLGNDTSKIKFGQLYEEVAEVTNSKGTRIERSIRHAIDTTFYHCPEYWEEVLNCKIISDNLTVTEFLSLCAEKISSEITE